MKMKFLILAVMMIWSSGKIFAQYTICFNHNAVNCPWVSTDPDFGWICIQENDVSCGGSSCNNGVQLCEKLTAGSTHTCFTFPNCTLNTCMEYFITIIPGISGGCNDANGINTSGWSMAYVNGAWNISPYGEHAGGNVGLTFDSGSLTFTCTGSGL